MAIAIATYLMLIQKNLVTNCNLSFIIKSHVIDQYINHNCPYSFSTKLRILVQSSLPSVVILEAFSLGNCHSIGASLGIKLGLQQGTAIPPSIVPPELRFSKKTEEICQGNSGSIMKFSEGPGEEYPRSARFHDCQATRKRK